MNTFWPRFGQPVLLPPSPPAVHCSVSMYSTVEKTKTPLPPVVVTFCPVASSRRRFWFPVWVKSRPSLYRRPASRQISSTCNARIRFRPTAVRPISTEVQRTVLRQNSIMVLPARQVRLSRRMDLAPSTSWGHTSRGAFHAVEGLRAKRQGCWISRNRPQRKQAVAMDVDLHDVAALVAVQSRDGGQSVRQIVLDGDQRGAGGSRQ